MLAFYLLLVGLAGTLATPVPLDEKFVEEKIEEPFEEEIEEPFEERDEEPFEERVEVLFEVKPEDRIVGGRNGRIEDVPYLVSLRMGTSHICGATIISANWVVSAAHCTTRAANQYSIRAGSRYRTSGGTIHQVSRLVNHPQYGRPTRHSNDICVMQVSTAFRMSNQVRAAGLPTANQAFAAGTWSRISGWGRLSSGGTSPNILQIADVPIVSQASCRSSYGQAAIGNDMICAGFAQGGVDACQGDSGGPLVIGGRLVGAVSWGRGCAAAGFPGVYASVPFFRNWIRTTTGV